MKRQLFMVSVLSVAGCFAAVSNAIAVEFVFTNVQIRSGETVEQQQNVVENFRVLQQTSTERKRQAAKEAAAARDQATASAATATSTTGQAATPATGELTGDSESLSTTPVSVEEEGFNIFSGEN